MPLEKRYIDVPLGFSGTSAGRKHEFIVDPPRNYYVQNGEITESGLIKPRSGYAPLSNTGVQISDVSEPYRLGMRGNTLIALEPDMVAEYSPELDGWHGLENTRSLVASEAWHVIAPVTESVTWCDCCVCGNYLFFAYESDNCYAHIYDLTTRSIIHTTDFYSTNHHIKFVQAYTNRMWAVVQESAGIRAYYIDCTTSDINNGWHSGLVIGSLGNQPMFDVCTDGSSLFIAAQSSTANYFRLIKVVGSSGAESYNRHVTLGATNYVTVCIDCMGVGTGDILVALCDGTNVYVETFDMATGFANSGTKDSVAFDAKSMVAFNYSDTHFGLFLSDKAASWEDDSITLYTVQISDDSLTESSTYYGCSLEHKAYGDKSWHDSDVIRIGIKHSDAIGSHIMTAEWDLVKGLCPVAIYSQLTVPAASDSYHNNGVSNVGVDDNGDMYFSFPRYYKGLYDSGASDDVTGVAIGKFSESANLRGNPLPVGNLTLLSGGQIMVWDGNCYFPLGFNHPPTITDDTPASGGSMTSTCDYQYIALFEFYDSHGNRYLSKTSDVYTVTMGGLDTQVTLTIRGLANNWIITSIGDVQIYCKVVLYRTVADGTVFYRVIPETEASNAPTNIIEDHTILDSESDTDLVAYGEYIYTYGGVLDNTCPPSTECLCLHKNRVWCVDTETGNIWYSKEIIQNEGISFTDYFIIQTDDQYNRPLWLVSMDDNLIVFWEDKIGIIYGDGANDLGQGSTLTAPKIVSPVGLKKDSRRATIKTDTGIMFVSNDGIKLLDRSLTVSDIGADVYDVVEGFDFQNAGMTSNYHQILFARNVESSNTVVTLAYDTLFNQWYYNVILASDSANLIDAVVIDDVHYILKDTGSDRVYSRDYAASSPIYYDHSATDSVVLYIKTPWIKIGDMQGFKRIWRALLLGERYGIHEVTVRIFYDYVTSSYDKIEIAKTETNISPYQLKIGMPKQKVQSVQFWIQIECPSGETQNALAGLSSLRLEYGVDPRNIYRKKVDTHTLTQY